MKNNNHPALNFMQSDPIHRLEFHANHFMASKEGQDLLKNIKDVDPNLHDIIKKQVDIHNNILNKLNFNPQQNPESY